MLVPSNIELTCFALKAVNISIDWESKDYSNKCVEIVKLLITQNSTKPAEGLQDLLPITTRAILQIQIG